MAHDMAIDAAELFGTIFEALIYGYSCALALDAIRTLKQRDRTHTSYVFLLAAFLLPVLATLHLAVDLYRIQHAFIALPTRVARMEFLSDVPNWSYIVKDGLYCTETFIADSILSYRCYVVWGRRLWAGLVPFVLCIGTIGCLSVANNQSGGIFQSEVDGFITSFWSFTLATNVVATSLITIPLARSERRMLHYAARDDLAPVITVVVESGGIYCCTCIITFIFFASRLNLQVLVLNTISSVIVVVFSLVLSRIGHRAGGHPSLKGSPSSRQFPSTPRERAHVTTLPRTAPVEIHMTRFIEHGSGKGDRGLDLGNKEDGLSV
ncbi:hypothetical protein GLOTRDRAFT_96434 [Gloeophyllum trabeum ATCC 11539]|uniref:Uncharacterized protein n=1 Tax=Gloeophyllum trabeum (strain ATCC 11539 / FP-39264 / Madison 617) TaxID=670483 RepID=S7RAE8_GLOTA|nr:uncharacterized protein GLOTRDRAFT_96434 [Gloeophyllum trabeum ATCC 11539]EPQ51235.1 hypothetical protein GLOTRDRAFT_96434 [Gloeophyllum trabeum ATCC 11539]